THYTDYRVLGTAPPATETHTLYRLQSSGDRTSGHRDTHSTDYSVLGTAPPDTETLLPLPDLEARVNVAVDLITSGHKNISRPSLHFAASTFYQKLKAADS